LLKMEFMGPTPQKGDDICIETLLKMQSVLQYYSRHRQTTMLYKFHAKDCEVICTNCMWIAHMLQVVQFILKIKTYKMQSRIMPTLSQISQRYRTGETHC